jgi:hypothetical protein
MDISQLAKKPKLEKLEINEKEIVEAYGEPISFWMMDHIDVNTYFSFYKLQQEENGSLLNELLRKIILKENGKAALGPDEVLPVDITLAVLVRINEHLGKSNAKVESTPETGKQSN